MGDGQIADVVSAVRIAFVGVFAALLGLVVPSLFGPRSVAFGSLLVVVGFLLGAVGLLELPSE